MSSHVAGTPQRRLPVTPSPHLPAPRIRWRERSGFRGDRPVRWLERPKPGWPGVVERHYVTPTSETRFAPLGRAITPPASIATVTIAHAARDTIAMRFFSATSIGRVETSGALFGYDRDDRLEIVRATGPGACGRHTRTTTCWDRRSIESDAYMRFGPGWRSNLVGDWHSHTDGSDDPSDTDLRGWLAGLRNVEAAGGSRYLGVIAVRRDGELQLVGYLLSRDSAGSLDVVVGVL